MALNNKSMTKKEQLYNELENLSDRQYLDFFVSWFGVDALWDMLRDSIESVDLKEIKYGLKMAKRLK